MSEKKEIGRYNLHVLLEQALGHEIITDPETSGAELGHSKRQGKFRLSDKSEGKIDEAFGFTFFPSQKRRNERVKESLRLLGKLFYGDLELLSDQVSELSSELPVHALESTLQTFDQMLKEAAAVGFPSVSQIFNKYFIGEVKEVSGKYFLHPINILAWRIYLADILNQLFSERSQLLNEVTKNVIPGDSIVPLKLWDQNDQNISKILGTFGEMPSVRDGKVVHLRYDLETPYFKVGQTGPYEYTRYRSNGVYLPDMEVVAALIEISTNVFERKERANRFETFQAVSDPSTYQEKLEKLLCDDNKKIVETAFGMPHEAVKRLFVEAEPKKKRGWW